VPHFTLQIDAGGPILTALVTVSQARRAALQAADQPIPAASQVRALVDTGASCTCVDPSVLAGLKLTPKGSVNINTASSGGTPHAADQYDVALVIPGPVPGSTPLIFPNIPVVASELLNVQGFHALIGRDILGLCLFMYNGETGLFTLAY
jgi:hypothetical protein